MDSPFHNQQRLNTGEVSGLPLREVKLCLQTREISFKDSEITQLIQCVCLHQSCASPSKQNLKDQAWTSLISSRKGGQTLTPCVLYSAEKHARNMPLTMWAQHYRILGSWSGITEESGKNKITCCLLYKQPHED